MMGWGRLVSCAVAGLFCLLLISQPVRAAEALPPGPLFMAYYGSWAEQPAEIPQATRIATLPAYLDIVVLGFARPDAQFDPLRPDDLSLTGLQTPYGGRVLAGAVAALHERHPSMRVLLAIGGSAYASLWDRYDPSAIAGLVKALGLDGVDLDYEPAWPGCEPAEIVGAPSIRCQSDARWSDLVNRTRAVLPRPALLTVPGWSVGAYGAGAFAADRPAGRYTGSMLWLGRDPAARQIDLVSVMAYEAGPSFDPERALAAYRSIWPGPLLLGAMVPPDGSGGLEYTVPVLSHYADSQRGELLGGVMLYSIEQAPPGSPSPARPDGEAAAVAICRGLGHSGC